MRDKATFWFCIFVVAAIFGCPNDSGAHDPEPEPVVEICDCPYWYYRGKSDMPGCSIQCWPDQ